MGAQVLRFPWINGFSAARNFALSCSKTDWNLILDADEYVVESDRGRFPIFISSAGSFTGI